MIKRPIDQRKLLYRPKAIKTKKVGLVTIPEKVESQQIETEISTEITNHTEIQWRLLKLGSEMGLDVWVARNDRNKEYNGNSFNNINRIKTELPRQFDEATTKTIELIDVLWLKGNAFVAAFEIEHSTQIYSGLLRMADLIAMQPNLNIPLYIVAPDERREQVIREVNRPVFSRLNPPMNRICSYISYSSLIESTSKASAFIRHLKPDFIEDIAESCALDNI